MGVSSKFQILFFFGGGVEFWILNVYFWRCCRILNRVGVKWTHADELGPQLLNKKLGIVCFALDLSCFVQVYSKLAHRDTNLSTTPSALKYDGNWY